jgi:hypothetical protein
MRQNSDYFDFKTGRSLLYDEGVVTLGSAIGRPL